MAEVSSRSDADQWSTSKARDLSNDEVEMLKKQDVKLVSDFRRTKLENEAQKMWDLFYKRNQTNFFKDRHWTSREFEELKNRLTENNHVTLLEAGCGVGNAIFPLIKDFPNLFVYACDFSPRAVQFVKDNENYSSDKCVAFQCDLSKQQLCDNVPEASVDIATLIFVLSAIHPDNFSYVLKNISKVLKPGGLLLFRDYGLHDWAMLRFSPGSKISDSFYVRQDGTRTYYFAKEQMELMVKECGFSVVSNEYVMRETVNHKKNISVPRVFLQGKYQRSAKSE